MYAVAPDVPNNYELARQWLLKPEVQDDKQVLNTLGVLYMQGLGVEANGDEAVKYFRKAADAGFAVAQCNLGVIYYEGKLKPQDFKESAKWFRLAADQDHPRATYDLGVMYRDGQGVPQDFAEAFRLFQKGAEKLSYAPAENNLGLLYYFGKGTPKDLVLAYMWISIAANGGYEPAKKYLQKVGQEMTAAQIKEANLKAQDWIKNTTQAPSSVSAPATDKRPQG
jgi:TPR repeat protein